MSKEFLLETAQARNKVSLPRVLQHEWGVRLPSERFVLTGLSWGLTAQDEKEDDDDADLDVMEGVETAEDEVGEDIEGEGSMNDLFGGEHDMEE